MQAPETRTRAPGSHQEAIQISGQIREEVSGASETGHEIRVTVVKGGKSLNGFYYDDRALRSIARYIEGARAYADHGRSTADQQTRSIRDMVGFYRDAQYIAHDPETPEGRVDATLHLFEAAGWLASIIVEAMKIGRPDLVGVSIDIIGVAEHDTGVQARRVSKVLSLNSCDVVTRASAGGAFQRILHDQGDNAMDEVQQENTTGSDEVESATDVQRTETEALLRELRQERAALMLERRLMESILPTAAQQSIRERFAGRIFEARELDCEINSIQGLLANLSNTGLISGHGYEKPSFSSQITEAEKVQAAFEPVRSSRYSTRSLFLSQWPFTLNHKHFEKNQHVCIAPLCIGV